MYSFPRSNVSRTCIVCNRSFLGAHNALYDNDSCGKRAYEERHYWPKAAKELNNLGWLVSANVVKGEIMLDTPPLSGGARRTLWLKSKAPISDLERQCRKYEIDFPLTGWADYQPGELQVSGELVLRALKKYALCEFCQEVVLRSEFIATLGICQRCLDEHKDTHEAGVWDDLKRELDAIKTEAQTLIKGLPTAGPAPTHRITVRDDLPF